METAQDEIKKEFEESLADCLIACSKMKQAIGFMATSDERNSVYKHKLLTLDVAIAELLGKVNSFKS